ncbi:hypothetical protein Btru_026161 [Bulinus truncatus]|nr:hypothetical protein Btru_026161 [Bulinus truncatus]
MFHHVRTYSHYFWLFCGGSISALAVYPHTLGLESFKESISNKSKVDLDVALLADEVKKDLKLPTTTLVDMNKIINIVPTDNLDFCSRGFLSTRWGVVVGLPKFFSSNSIEKSQEDKDLLKNYGIDISTNRGLEILETFNLSNEAKKYALAKEINMANTAKIYLYSAGLGFTFILSYIVSQPFNSFVLSALSFCTVLPLSIYLCIKLYDTYNCYYEKDCDTKLASLNKELANGGIEYYSSLLKRKQYLGETETRTSAKDKLLKAFDCCCQKSELTVAEKLNYLTEIVKQKYGTNGPE